MICDGGESSLIEVKVSAPFHASDTSNTNIQHILILHILSPLRRAVIPTYM